MVKMYMLPRILVEDVMTTEAPTVYAEDDLGRLIDVFKKYHYHSYTVIDKKNKVVGIARYSDVVHMFVEKTAASAFHEHVSDIMRSPLATVSPGDSIRDAIQEMFNSGNRIAPVVDRERHLLGVITYTDIAKCIEAVE